MTLFVLLHLFMRSTTNLNISALSNTIMSEDSPLSPMTPPSTPFLSTAPSDPKTIPTIPPIQLPTESPLITGMTAALDANMNDLHMPAAAYTRSTWIVADDDDIPPLVAETIPFVSVDSPADSPADSPLDLPVDRETSTDTRDATCMTDPMDTSDTTDISDASNLSEPDYTWSDVPSDSDEEDSRIPPRPWDGLPTAIVVLFFAYMFTQSIGIWSGRLWV